MLSEIWLERLEDLDPKLRWYMFIKNRMQNTYSKNQDLAKITSGVGFKINENKTKR